MCQKRTYRSIAVLLALLMLLSCAAVALADGETPGSTETPTSTATPTPTPTSTATPTPNPTATPEGTGDPIVTPPSSVRRDLIELSKWYGNDEKSGVIPAISGERDKAVDIPLPLVALEGPLSEIEIEPVLSTSLDSFPFVIPSMVMKQERGSMNKGECWPVWYRGLVLSHNVTKGVKQVDFTVRYVYNGEHREQTLSVFVNVTKGASMGGGGGGTSYRAQPKLIVESYSLSTDKLYAGEPFELTMVLRNTSSDEGIKNIQLHMKDETGTVLPAKNGSNTIYIKQIEKESTETVKVSLQAAPDAEAKGYALAITFGYDGEKSKQAYTAEESITMPVQQRIRVKCDDPLVYDEPWQGQTAAVGVALYNMGKSTIYNCMVLVEGSGLSMPETFFGGNVSSGGTMRAEFDVQTDVAGEILGTVIVSYEDVYGGQYEERLPLTMFVNEQMHIEPALDDPMGFGGDTPAAASVAIPGIGFVTSGNATGGNANHANGGAGGSTVWYILGGAIAVVGGAVAVLGVRRKRRKKELSAL